MANIPMIERLRGRENYDSWKFAVENYLVLDDLWKSVQGTEDKAEKIAIAKAKLVLLVDQSLNVHIKEAKTAEEGCRIVDKKNIIFATATETDKVYRLNTVKNNSAQMATESQVDLWHRRMGHLGLGAEVMRSLELDGDNNCIVCCEGKQSNRMFKASTSSTNDFLELIHSDVAGPIKKVIIGRCQVLCFILG